MNRKKSNLALITGSAALAAAFAAPSHAVLIVDDNFADGDRSDTGTEPLEADFYASSTSSAIEASAGVLGLVSGSSGRQIHGVFTPVTLGSVGDSVTASFTFRTPATLGSDEDNALAFGLFDSLGRAGLAADTAYNSSNPNPLYGDQGLAPGSGSGGNGVITGTTPGIPGFAAYYDMADLSSGSPDDEVQIRQHDIDDARGRLLSTTSGFDTVADEPATGDVLGWTADTVYTASIEVTRTSATEVTVTADIPTLTGTTGPISAASLVADSFTFDFIGIGASSGAFGSTSSQASPDNGIDISNVTVEFNPIPEPSAAVLGLLGGLALIGKRRKA